MLPDPQGLFVRKKSLDLSYIGLIGNRYFSQVSLALGGFLGAVELMSPVCLAVQYLAVLSEFETLLCTAVCLDLGHLKYPP